MAIIIPNVTIGIYGHGAGNRKTIENSAVTVAKAVALPKVSAICKLDEVSPCCSCGDIDNTRTDILGYIRPTAKPVIVQPITLINTGSWTKATVPVIIEPKKAKIAPICGIFRDNSGEDIFPCVNDPHA